MAKGIFFLCAIVILMSGCGGPITVSQVEQSGAGQLSSPEILQLVEGNSLHCESFQEDLTLYFDASRRIFVGDLNKNKDQGRWDISNQNELCFKLNTWWYNDLRCFKIYSEAGKLRLFTPNGALVYTGRQIPGDSKHLYVAGKSKRESYRPAGEKKNQGLVQGDEAQGGSTSLVEGKRPTAQPISRDQELKTTVKWMARDCPGCNLANADLRKADLVGAQLRDAKLTGANLRQANLRRADLQNADLSDAVLAYANLPGANLRDCNLRNADLTGANLILADFTGADLEGAILKGAHMEGVKGLPRN